MAKIGAYILSFFFLGNLFSLQAGLSRAISRFPFAYAGAMALHCGIAHQTALQRLYYMACDKNNDAQMLDAMPEVRQFVVQRLQKHGLSTEGVLVKVKSSEGSSFSCFKKTIYMRSDIHVDFLSILKKAELTQQEQDRLYKYTMTVDHEIAHMKNNDVLKDRIVIPAVSIGLHALAWAAAKKLKATHCFKPPYFEIKDGKDPVYKGFLIAAGTGFGLHVAHRALTHYWFRYKESLADKFALQNVENAAAFDAYINYYNESEQKDVALCAKIAASHVDPTVKDVLTMQGAPLLGILYFHLYVTWLYRYYQYSITATQQSIDHFKQWLVARPSFPYAMRQICSATHPSHQQRIEQARHYAAEFVKKHHGQAV